MDQKATPPPPPKPSDSYPRCKVSATHACQRYIAPLTHQVIFDSFPRHAVCHRYGTPLTHVKTPLTMGACRQRLRFTTMFADALRCPWFFIRSSMICMLFLLIGADFYRLAHICSVSHKFRLAWRLPPFAGLRPSPPAFAGPRPP